LSQKEIPFWVDRFRKEKGEPLSQRMDEMMLYFLPFWRFTTQVFYSLFNQSSFVLFPENSEMEILTKDWDINFSAHLSNDLGLATLGMRPDWLKLKLLTDMALLKEGEVLSLELDSSSAKERGSKSLHLYLDGKKSAEEQLVFKLLEESLSLIYFPLWVVNFIAGGEKHYQIIDGITERTLKQSHGYFELKKNQNGKTEHLVPLKIIPHRCPNCGWDLPVDPFHLVFPCDNCQRIWKISGNGYESVKGQIAKVREDHMEEDLSDCNYYPFWVFETRPKQETKFSIQSLVELFPSEIGWFKVKDKSQPFLFYVPAFEIKNLNKIPTISLAFTRTQPELETQIWENEKLSGAIRSEEDAKKLAELLWTVLFFSRANTESNDCPDLALENAKLVWCPYYEEGIFLRDAVVGFAFQTIKSSI